MTLLATCRPDTDQTSDYSDQQTSLRPAATARNRRMAVIHECRKQRRLRVKLRTTALDFCRQGSVRSHYAHYVKRAAISGNYIFVLAPLTRPVRQN